MKRFLLLFVVSFCIQLTPAKAQWVNIPDTNFVNKLTQLYPGCMNGDLMDTTCAIIVNEDSLILSYLNIINLTGIEYFDSLKYLKCNSNLLIGLPQLPVSLTNLQCNNNQLTSLPSLPNSLLTLNCSGNLQLSTSVALPNSLRELFWDGGQLTSLPALPNTLIRLSCRFNQLTSLPVLPNSLIDLFCDNNQLTSLPPLTSSLKKLWCNSNALTSIPTLPNSLKLLICSSNQLVSIPAIPNSMMDFDCRYNQITNLPLMPAIMITFNISYNNITCVTNLPQISGGSSPDISNNLLTCVPNQTNYSLSLPLCFDNDSINNPYNCPGVNITGNVYTDQNNDCNFDITDLSADNIPVKLLDNQSNLISTSYTVAGAYSFTTLPPDSYQIKIEDIALPIAITCGQANIQAITLDSINQTISNIDFPVLCDNAYDIDIHSINTMGWAFPNQTHLLNTNILSNEAWYNLDCDSLNYSGTVSLNITGPATYLAPANNALTPTINGNNFIYNITDFSTLTPQSFGLKFLTDTTAQAGDQICVHVEINPTPIDADTTNNSYDFCYQVINSYDPNMKEVYPVNILPGYDDWFTYTIHFQNTGNAPAFNIRLRDTLDANLDINTFEVRGYSHPAIVSINGNILTVRFNNIMLPDSTADYEGSMGYFQYHIKPLSNLPLGTKIENTAYIYFDFNAPIITNTTQNNFQMVVANNTLNANENQLKIYPNPANQNLIIDLQNSTIESCELFDALGQCVYSSAKEFGAKSKINLNISNLNAGVYFVKVRSGSGSYTSKFIKEK